VGQQPWKEDKAPAALFAAMAMVSMRNIPVASLVLIPVLARSLPTISATRSDRPRRTGAVAMAALVLLGAGATAKIMGRPAYDLSAYPVAELAWMRGHGLLGQRVATPDFVGNYRTWTEGGHGEVFIDDRYDMYPRSVDVGEFTLFQGEPGWDAVLDRYRIGAVLWPRRTPLAQIISRDSRWKIEYETTGWVVATRSASSAP
jgi:hypothetical protein